MTTDRRWQVSTALGVAAADLTRQVSRGCLVGRLTRLRTVPTTKTSR
jgi:hypothetical protein